MQDCLITLQGHSDAVRTLFFLEKDPSQLVSGSYDSTLKVWDINKEKHVEFG